MLADLNTTIITWAPVLYFATIVGIIALAVYLVRNRRK